MDPATYNAIQAEIEELQQERIATEQELAEKKQELVTAEDELRSAKSGMWARITQPSKYKEMLADERKAGADEAMDAIIQASILHTSRALHQSSMARNIVVCGMTKNASPRNSMMRRKRVPKRILSTTQKRRNFVENWSLQCQMPRKQTMKTANGFVITVRCAMRRRTFNESLMHLTTHISRNLRRRSARKTKR